MSYCTLDENVAPGTCPKCEAELAALKRIATTALACVKWQKAHDKIENSECRACAGEPPHFPWTIPLLAHWGTELVGIVMGLRV